MSKAAAPAPAEKASSVYTPIIECVLEDVVPVNTDSVVKVKHFKRFLNYDLKTLNITGKLYTSSHSNGLRETKMNVTYQDKKTNKVNYLEIDVIDNIIKKVESTIKKAESTIKKAENTSKQSECAGCPPPPDDYPGPDCTLVSCTPVCSGCQGPCPANASFYCPYYSVNSVVSSSTDTALGLSAKSRTGATFVGKQVLMYVRGKQCKVFSHDV